MPDDTQVMQAGEATLTVITVGDPRAGLGDGIPVPGHERPARYDVTYGVGWHRRASPMGVAFFFAPGAMMPWIHPTPA